MPKEQLPQPQAPPVLAAPELLELDAPAVDGVFEEASSEEIALATATTTGNVRVIRHRSLGQLRECVERPVAS